jgi:hypothetical protein
MKNFGKIKKGISFKSTPFCKFDQTQLSNLESQSMKQVLCIL